MNEPSLQTLFRFILLLCLHWNDNYGAKTGYKFSITIPKRHGTYYGGIFDHSDTKTPKQLCDDLPRSY